MRSLMSGLAAAATMLLCSQAQAGAEVKPGANMEVATPPAVISNAENPVRDQRKLPGQILRCWQNGRLVYEAGGFRGGADKNGAIAVPRAVEGEPVSLFDLRDGMCILSTH